jgi:hypothetical protein
MFVMLMLLEDITPGMATGCFIKLVALDEDISLMLDGRF